MARHRIGFTITPHGFGHAARAAAVMGALADRLDVEFVIAGSVPEWFFRESVQAPFTLHPVQADIGCVQQSSLDEDLPATIAALDDFYPLGKPIVSRVARLFSGCQLVVSDIAPLGLVVAEQLAVPSVLIENFTWDWIYEGYLQQWPGFEPHIRILRDLYTHATHHIQAEPLCSPHKGALQVGPIARPLRGSGDAIRQALQVTEKDRLVLVAMGGVPDRSLSLAPLLARDDFVFLLPGYAEQLIVEENLRFLPHHSTIYHPDCVAEADVVIGKAGYSTVAEVYQSGTPFAYIERPAFRESATLAAFIEQHIPSHPVTTGEWKSGQWLDEVDRLASMPKKKTQPVNGADQVAAFLGDLLARDRNVS